MPKRLYLIDSSIYIFKAWNALSSSITNSEGQVANATYGFSEFLLQLIEYEAPVFMICAFDKSRALSARKKIYPAYKANRQPAPEALKEQFSWCEEFAQGLGIPSFASPKYEADDIIGTLANHAREQGLQNIIISADKDLIQFIGTNDIFWDFTQKRRYNLRDIRKRYNLNPAQIPDMLALAGDKVDNIPGVPGVGMRTASRLLFKWGSLDNLYANLDKAAEMKFRGAKRAVQLVGEHRELVYRSRKLTGLLMDDSLPNKVSDLKISPSDEPKMEELYQRFNFSSQRKARWQRVLEKHATGLLINKLGDLKINNY